MSDITKIKVDGELESTYKLFSKNREFEKRAGGNGDSQSSVQHDWNQNDETQPDYIKNRPFYTGDPVETVLLEETTAEFANKGRFYAALIPANFSLEVGATYKVSWDGTVYSCVGYYFNEIASIGNQYVLTSTSDTGEPFYCVVDHDSGTLTIATKDTSASHTISIIGVVAPVTKIDEKYLPELQYMDKVNPTGTGSFSLNRKADTTIGSYSFAEGSDTTASGDNSHAEGYSTTASGDSSHAEGSDTTASGNYSHAEGVSTIASGDRSHAEGSGTTASSFCSHAEGSDTTAASEYQHVQGKFNIIDNDKVYAHIVGNGYLGSRSNAHTLDWNGNAWFAGTVEGKALILPSSTEGSTKKFKITVDDSGTLTTTEVT